MKNDINEKQKELNQKLAQVLKKYGIKNVRMTSVGNSIGSGYSMVRTIKPLLLRNVTLSDILKSNDITLSTHHFARAQNNSDEHILEWYEENIKESEIHKMNRSDYSKEETSMPVHGLTKEMIDDFYPLEMEENLGLKDIVTKDEEELANIVVYNGATGSFLDGLTRHGTFGQQMLHGIKRDINSIDATLKLIQTNNRNKKSNTQVYLCGAPNFLGIGISNVINNKLKTLSKKYANVVYVEPVKSKLLYKGIDDEGNETNKKAVDIHYDEKEYIKFNNNIINKINENYGITKAIINLDRFFYDLNKEIELENKKLVSDSDNKKEMIAQAVDKELELITDKEEKSKFLKTLKKYMTSRFPYDFVYLGKPEINDTIENRRKI